MDPGRGSHIVPEEEVLSVVLSDSLPESSPCLSRTSHFVDIVRTLDGGTVRDKVYEVRLSGECWLPSHPR